MSADHPDWHGDVFGSEPPQDIRTVRDAEGGVADRLGPCGEWCRPDGSGSVWRWRHNGNSDCWLEIDGIGPWVGWKSPPAA